MSIGKTTLALTILLGLAPVGCYSQKGGIMPQTGGGFTYYSTESEPKSITIYDIRTGDEVFAMDIPPGKQLTFRFFPGEGDDSVYTPDLMKWQVFEMGTSSGSLRSSMTVPNSASRKIEVSIREGYEYAEGDPEERMRVDRVSDRPDWWTPEGGEVPANAAAVTNYDD